MEPFTARIFRTFGSCSVHLSSSYRNDYFARSLTSRYTFPANKEDLAQGLIPILAEYNAPKPKLKEQQKTPKPKIKESHTPKPQENRKSVSRKSVNKGGGKTPVASRLTQVQGR